MPQGVDVGTVLLVAVGCVVLCFVGIGLSIGLSFIGNFLHMFTQFFQLFTHILSGGPVSWCGCLLLILSCFVCTGVTIFIVSFLPSCSGPNAINFCRLIGR